MGSYDTGGLRPPESVRKSCAAADGPYVAAMPVRRKLTLSGRDGDRRIRLRVFHPVKHNETKMKL